MDVVRPPRAARRDADEPQLRVDVFQISACAARIEQFQRREARDGVDDVRGVRRELSLRVQRVLDGAAFKRPRPQARRRFDERARARRFQNTGVPIAGAPPRELVAHVHGVVRELQALRDLVDDEIALQAQRRELRRLARRRPR